MKQLAQEVAMAKEKPTNKTANVTAAVLCLAVLCMCCGMPTGCYVLLKSDLITDWIMASHFRELAERKQKLDDTLTGIAEDSSLLDDEAVVEMARVIFGEDDRAFYDVQRVTVTNEPESPLTVRVTVLQEIEFEMGRFEPEGEHEMMTEGLPLFTVSDVLNRTAVLAMFGQRRDLASVEVLVRSRVLAGGGKEDIDAFEFSIPPENCAKFVEDFQTRATDNRFGRIDRDEMEDIWIVHQDNFDEIVITVQRR